MEHQSHTDTNSTAPHPTAATTSTPSTLETRSHTETFAGPTPVTFSFSGLSCTNSAPAAPFNFGLKTASRSVSRSATATDVLSTMPFQPSTSNTVTAAVAPIAFSFSGLSSTSATTDAPFNFGAKCANKKTSTSDTVDGTCVESVYPWVSITASVNDRLCTRNDEMLTEAMDLATPTDGSSSSTVVPRTPEMKADPRLLPSESSSVPNTTPYTTGSAASAAPFSFSFSGLSSTSRRTSTAPFQFALNASTKKSNVRASRHPKPSASVAKSETSLDQANFVSSSCSITDPSAAPSSFVFSDLSSTAAADNSTPLNFRAQKPGYHATMANVSTSPHVEAFKSDMVIALTAGAIVDASKVIACMHSHLVSSRLLDVELTPFLVILPEAVAIDLNSAACIRYSILTVLTDHLYNALTNTPICKQEDLPKVKQILESFETTLRKNHAMKFFQRNKSLLLDQARQLLELEWNCDPLNQLVPSFAGVLDALLAPSLTNDLAIPELLYILLPAKRSFPDVDLLPFIQVLRRHGAPMNVVTNKTFHPAQWFSIHSPNFVTWKVDLFLRWLAWESDLDHVLHSPLHSRMSSRTFLLEPLLNGLNSQDLRSIRPSRLVRYFTEITQYLRPPPSPKGAVSDTSPEAVAHWSRVKEYLNQQMALAPKRMRLARIQEQCVQPTPHPASCRPISDLIEILRTDPGSVELCAHESHSPRVLLGDLIASSDFPQLSEVGDIFLERLNASNLAGDLRERYSSMLDALVEMVEKGHFPLEKGDFFWCVYERFFTYFRTNDYGWRGILSSTLPLVSNVHVSRMVLVAELAEIDLFHLLMYHNRQAPLLQWLETHKHSTDGLWPDRQGEHAGVSLYKSLLNPQISYFFRISLLTIIEPSIQEWHTVLVPMILNELNLHLIPDLSRLCFSYLTRVDTLASSSQSSFLQNSFRDDGIRAGDLLHVDDLRRAGDPLGFNNRHASSDVGDQETGEDGHSLSMPDMDANLRRIELPAELDQQ